jgi:hypothetical protein
MLEASSTRSSWIERDGVNIVYIGVVRVDEEGCAVPTELTVSFLVPVCRVQKLDQENVSKIKNSLHAWAAQPFQTLLHSAYIEE